MIITTLVVIFVAILIVGLLWYGVTLLPIDSKFKQFAQIVLVFLLIIICIIQLLRLAPLTT